MSINGEQLSDEERAARGMEVRRNVATAIGENLAAAHAPVTAETSQYHRITSRLKEVKVAAVGKVKSSIETGAQVAENFKKGIKAKFWLKLTSFMCTVGALIDPEPISKAALGIGATSTGFAAGGTEAVAFIKSCKEIRAKNRANKAIRREALINRVMFWKESSPVSMQATAARV